jgi:hypothetical protein
LDTFLLLLLFLWLGSSAAMTIITALAERRYERALTQRAGYTGQPAFPGPIAAAPEIAQP